MTSKARWHCTLPHLQDSKGRLINWGYVPWEKLFGPQGYCVAENPVVDCGTGGLVSPATVLVPVYVCVCVCARARARVCLVS